MEGKRGRDTAVLLLLLLLTARGCFADAETEIVPPVVAVVDDDDLVVTARTVMDDASSACAAAERGEARGQGNEGAFIEGDMWENKRDRTRGERFGRGLKGTRAECRFALCGCVIDGDRMLLLLCVSL